ncbi:uncharacterized protein LOC132555542 [Ylistrum balloti]|uniref:uncharacterized protein LOC132555542 n=1 Tax=Ylistrum balloti TaxID=509963 RepID=UPI0029059501|nr:uncharacterized protein LOC132555542 [Ylistrum balloti]
MGKKQAKKSVAKRPLSIPEKRTRQRNSSCQQKINDDSLPSGEGRRNIEHLFPQHTIWIVFVLTLYTRISYVSKVDNWWVLHPDEIFQSVEVAHSEFYGYGFRPYEYMPPLEGANSTSVGRLQENLLGMYSLRSFLYPKLLVIALHVATVFGYTGSPMLFWKIFHTSVTSCLPLAVYTFTKILYKSRDVAVLASVLSSTSVFTYVLGTHTLLNSFISPFLFWALVPLFRLLVDKPEMHNLITTPEAEVNVNISDKSRNITIKSEDNLSAREKSSERQEMVVANQNRTGMKNYEHSNKEPETMGTMKTDHVNVVLLKNGNGEFGKSKTVNCLGNSDIPNTEITNTLYTSIHLTENQLTNIHKGIIYEIIHHCTKPSRVTAPHLKFERNTLKSRDRKHVTNFGDTPTDYDQLGVIDDHIDTDFNHNSQDLHKPDRQTLEQRNLTNRKQGTYENFPERVKTDHMTPNNNGSLHPNNDILDVIPNNVYSTTKTVCRGNEDQSTSKEQTEPTPSSLASDTVTGSRKRSSREKTEKQIKKEAVKTMPTESLDCDKCPFGTSLRMQHFTCLFSGFILALCLYVRADLFIFVAFAILPYLKCVCNCKLLMSHPFLLYCLGILIGFSVGIFDDYNSYGTLVISPWQWFSFNVLRDKSAIFFGKKHWSFYLWELFVHDEVMFVCLVVSALTFMAVKCNQISYHEQYMSANVKLFMTLLAVFITHSLNSHKEVRFVHDFIVLLLIFYSSFIIVLIKTCKGYLGRDKGSLLSHSIVLAIVAYLYSSQWRYFPSPASGWAFRDIKNTNHVNKCLDFLRQQNDATGVFLDTSVHTTGGFSTLHKNVPLIALIHNEFYEFDVDSKLSHKSTLPYFSQADNLSLTLLTQISDFVSVYNTPYLLKILINKPVYNYLVMSTDRPFVDVGFQEVYRTGDMRILKRSLASDNEAKLKSIARNIPLGPSCKILDYEANWLLTFGLYDKAVSKLSYSLYLDKTNLQSYQLLREVRRRQGDVTGARDVYKMCGQYHGHQSCTARPGRIILHQEYRLDVNI